MSVAVCNTTVPFATTAKTDRLRARHVSRVEVTKNVDHVAELGLHIKWGESLWVPRTLSTRSTRTFTK